MKKQHRIAFIFVAISVAFGSLFWTLHAQGDSIVMEYDLDRRYTIQLRARDNWEVSIPVYITVNDKQERDIILRSSSIYFYSPEFLERKMLGDGLHIEIAEQIFFVYHGENRNKILSMICLDDHFIYPASETQEDQYYTQIDHFFTTLKVLLKNDQLQLSGWSR